MSVSVVLENVCATTGEGPYWDEATQTLYYVDIQCGGMQSWNCSTGERSKIKMDDEVGFVIPRKSGGFVIGLGRKICLFDWATKEVTPIGEVEKRGTDNRLNDAKCDPSGRLWTGTMGYEGPPGTIEPQMACLYSFDAEHNLKLHVDNVDISNGMAWSADHKTMYYIDSMPRKVYAFDYDIEAGTLSNQRTIIDFNELGDEYGSPDGMAIDTEDKIWIACYNGARVVRFDPKNGEELRMIEFPARRITSLCFGGPDYEELFVTCGKFGLTEEEFENEQPLAGSVFKVTGLGVKGVPPTMYSG